MTRSIRSRDHSSSGARRLCAVAVVLLFCLIAAMIPQGASLAGEFYAAGSLPEIAKKINQLIYPTFGNPCIAERGGQFTIEWDWRLSNASIPLASWAIPPVSQSRWKVTAKTSVAANIQHYNGATNDQNQWYSYRNPADPYGYGTYDKPVHTAVRSCPLTVTSVSRGPSAAWPEVFGRTGFVVDRISVQVPTDMPLELYDLRIEYTGNVPFLYPAFIPPERRAGIRSDSQPHALQVIDEFKKDLKVLQITDTHVFGQEIQNAFGLEYSSFELREPRPGTPNRKLSPTDRLLLKYDDFPLDKDGDGKVNEGAIYFQEQLQAINLINPDFVVFTGDSTFAQKNWNTYPKDAWPFVGTPGDVGSEYRFEYPWGYDELLALNVPVFCVPGNHDGYCWDGHQLEGGLAHDDGLEIWQDLFGPLYRSWDYGGYHFLGLNSMDWPKKDTNGPELFPPLPIFPDLDDRNGVNYLGFITNPNKWHGQVRGGGDRWATGTAPAGSGLRWDPGNPDTYTGQLGWMRWDLENNMDKKLRGVFIHHDPLRNLGENPGMWDHASQFGLQLPAGQGEGSQALVHLMRKYNVAFEASGHAHSDWVGKVPWYVGPGELVAINTTAVEIPVGDGALASPASANYAGFRLLQLDNGSLANWGFAGAAGDPSLKWSIPAYAGTGVGTATPGNPTPNGLDLYRKNRPSLQWMEQDQAAQRPQLVDGNGTFTTPERPGEVALPLNELGPFTDVTCKVVNTLDGTLGAKLDLTGCRIEFAMKALTDGSHYAVQNGTIVNEYIADTGERMVIVLADVPGGATVPVRVYATN